MQPTGLPRLVLFDNKNFQNYKGNNLLTKMMEKKWPENSVLVNIRKSFRYSSPVKAINCSPTRGYGMPFPLWQSPNRTVWDEYKFFGRMNIRIYLYHRYWTNEYPNIFGMIKISRMNIRINSPLKKLTKFFANEYMCPKYLNVFKYQIIFPRLLPNSRLTILPHPSPCRAVQGLPL